jgi:hypothetical protein
LTRPLVKYAGQTSAAESRAQNMEFAQSVRATVMFRSGRDTLEIAEALKASEADVLRWINEDRSLRKSRPNPYGGAS